MKKIITFLIIQIYFLAVHAQVSVDATIDSTNIFIGQQTGITLQVSADTKSSIEFPFYSESQEIIPGVEVLYSSKIDTNIINNGKRCVLTQKHVITSFEPSLYYIPPITVKVNGKEYKSKNLALKVNAVKIDTLHTDSIYGLKDVIYPQIEFKDIASSLISLLLLIISVVGFIFMLIRLINNKPIFHRIHHHQRIAPHKFAMMKIQKIKEENLIFSENSKEYYTQLTDILRQYMSERFGFNAMEMTSAEIIAQLEKNNNKEYNNELRELFETADLVKFAKYTTLNNENDRNLTAVIDYIDKTKIEENIQLQPEIEIVEDKQSKVNKTIIIILLCLFCVISICSLGYLIYRLYYLFI